MSTQCELVSNVVDVDPSNYVPTLPVSAHLSFVNRSCPCNQIHQMETIEMLLSQNPPDEVCAWLNNQLEGLKLVVKNAVDRAHETNSRVLAERVVHKFKKWGPVRFGCSDRCKRCFYTGYERVDSNDNPVTYDPVFEAKLRELAGSEADKILDNLHIGQASAQRFHEFIHVSNLESSSSLTEDGIFVHQSVIVNEKAHPSSSSSSSSSDSSE